MLDHNNHNSREQQKNSSGEIVYHRKYRKQTKKWDTTPTLTSKKYEYIPELLKVIFDERATTSVPLKRKLPLSPQHPARLQETIAHKPPEDTASLVANKRSRFQ